MKDRREAIELAIGTAALAASIALAVLVTLSVAWNGPRKTSQNVNVDSRNLAERN
jgi:hypothetical protein